MTEPGTAHCPAHPVDFDPYDPALTDPSVWRDHHVPVLSQTVSGMISGV